MLEDTHVAPESIERYKNPDAVVEFTHANPTTPFADTATACHPRFVACGVTPSMLTVDEPHVVPVLLETYKYPPLTHVTWIAPVSALTATSCQFRGVTVFAFALPSMVMPELDQVAPVSNDR
jgi:hypothetical protein